MWLARQGKTSSGTADADLGTTSISGGSAGIITRGEVRTVPVYGPGGYVWMPENGDTVLVIKGGPGGEEHCAVGTRQKQTPGGMQPGEVYLYAGGGSVYLKKDGSIVLTGKVSIKGELEVNGSVYGGDEPGSGEGA